MHDHTYLNDHAPTEYRAEVLQKFLHKKEEYVNPLNEVNVML